ncbi:copper(I)-binding protein [Undibacterium sp. GrIS 1.8]|uniref:copper chaperone PCu(A)C n=1 Tax=unclassified Undibacterium TaxID=2630295 RepID=UPI003390D73F
MKSTLKSICLISALFSVVMTAQAEVTIKDAWVRATVPQQKATGAFMQIQSSSDVHIVEIQTTAAGIAEIHEMKTENNVMRMRAVPQLDLLAGKLLELKPGGFHVMLMDLKAQIKEGDIIPLTIIVEGKDKKREVIEVKAKARALNAAQSKM